MQLNIPNPVILVTGACGQIGTEMVKALREKYGRKAVISSDIHAEKAALFEYGFYMYLDVMDAESVAKVIKNRCVTHIYHLAGILSASGENDPLHTWDVNIKSLLNILEAARLENVKQVFWPSSIAVFGPGSMHYNCSQDSRPDPTTAYGISKSAGEYWCRYYYDQYGLDVRSLRYPGLIGHSANPGGGTTDYAVDIFRAAAINGHYECYLKDDVRLPMLYMHDAVRAALELMDASLKGVRKVTAYNLRGMSFTPDELASAIKLHIPEFRIFYQPDTRQHIADSWPCSIDGSAARQDWGWNPEFDIRSMTADMLLQLKQAT